MKKFAEWPASCKKFPLAPSAIDLSAGFGIEFGQALRKSLSQEQALWFGGPAVLEVSPG